MPLANGADGGTDGTLVSSANSGGASGDPFDVVATGTIMRYGVDQSAHGGMAYRIPQGATFATGNLEWTASIGGGQPTLWGRAYYRFSSVAPSANMNLFRFVSGTTTCANLRLNTTGSIQFTNTSGVAAGTASAALSADTWYRIEYTISFSTTAGSGTANIYLLDDTTPVTSTSCTGQNFGAASAGTVRTGNIAAGGTNMTTWVDDIQVNNTGFPGPAAPPAGAVFETTGGAAARAAVAAGDVFEATETGSATSGTASQAGDIYEATETGSVTSAAVSAAPDVYQATEAGSVTTRAVPAGPDVYQATETASAAAAAAAAGQDAYQATETGVVTSAAAQSAGRAIELPSTGTAAAGTASRGVAQAGFTSKTATVTTATRVNAGDVFTASETATTAAVTYTAAGGASEAARVGTATTSTRAGGGWARVSPVIYAKAGALTLSVAATANRTLQTGRTGSVTTTTRARGAVVGAPMVARWTVGPSDRWTETTGPRWPAATQGSRWP